MDYELSMTECAIHFNYSTVEDDRTISVEWSELSQNPAPVMDALSMTDKGDRDWFSIIWDALRNNNLPAAQATVEAFNKTNGLRRPLGVSIENVWLSL